MIKLAQQPYVHESGLWLWMYVYMFTCIYIRLDHKLYIGSKNRNTSEIKHVQTHARTELTPAHKRTLSFFLVRTRSSLHAIAMTWHSLVVAIHTQTHKGASEERERQVCGGWRRTERRRGSKQVRDKTTYRNMIDTLLCMCRSLFRILSYTCCCMCFCIYFCLWICLEGICRSSWNTCKSLLKKIAPASGTCEPNVRDREHAANMSPVARSVLQCVLQCGAVSRSVVQGGAV